MTGRATYQLSLHIPQADMLPLLTCLAILLKGNACSTCLSNDTCFRLDDIYQMGLEMNTSVEAEKAKPQMQLTLACGPVS
jgi:hypothetical protein